MKLIHVGEYADLIRANCMEMLNSALAQPTLSSKFDMTVDLKDILPELKDKANLVFSARAYAKLVLLVTHSDKEVAAHGTAFRIAPKEQESSFLVDDIFIYPQEATAATVDSNDKEYGPWLGRQPDEIFNNLRFQVHSHVRMSTTPSGTDRSFYHKLMQTTPNFYIFFIINKQLEVWCEIYDIERNIYFENGDIKHSVLLGVDDDSLKFLDSMTANVQAKKYSEYAYTTPPTNKPAFTADATKPSEEEKKTRGRPRKNPSQQNTGERSGIERASNSSETDKSGVCLHREGREYETGTNTAGTRTVYNPNFGKAVVDYLTQGGKQR